MYLSLERYFAPGQKEIHVGLTATIEKYLGLLFNKYLFFSLHTSLFPSFLSESLIPHLTDQLPSPGHANSTGLGGAQSKMRLWWARLNEN